MGIEDGGALQGEPLLCAAYCTSPEKARAALAPHFLVLIVENVKPVLSLKIDVVENKKPTSACHQIEPGSRKPYSNKSHEVWIRKGSSNNAKSQSRTAVKAKSDRQKHLMPQLS